MSQCKERRFQQGASHCATLIGKCFLPFALFCMTDLFTLCRFNPNRQTVVKLFWRKFRKKKKENVRSKSKWRCDEFVIRCLHTVSLHLKYESGNVLYILLIMSQYSSKHQSLMSVTPLSHRAELLSQHWDGLLCNVDLLLKLYVSVFTGSEGDL